MQYCINNSYWYGVNTVYSAFASTFHNVTYTFQKASLLYLLDFFTSYGNLSATYFISLSKPMLEVIRTGASILNQQMTC